MMQGSVPLVAFAILRDPDAAGDATQDTFAPRVRV